MQWPLQSGVCSLGFGADSTYLCGELGVLGALLGVAKRLDAALPPVGCASRSLPHWFPLMFTRPGLPLTFYFQMFLPWRFSSST